MRPCPKCHSTPIVEGASIRCPTCRDVAVVGSNLELATIEWDKRCRSYEILKLAKEVFRGEVVKMREKK